MQEMINLAESKLGFLKIVTPKESRNASGKSHFVLRDGKLVDGRSQQVDRAIKTGIDPEDLARHHRLIRRQHFLERK